jgi:NIPSNAP
MITVIRTATAFPGEMGEALAWAKQIATIVKRVTGKEQLIATSFAGLLADIAWIGRYDSVAQYDELRTAVIADHEYRDAIKKARQLFVPGSERDQVWKHEQ